MSARSRLTIAVLAGVFATGFAAMRARPVEPVILEGLVVPSEIPEAAISALTQGRHFHASRILETWLASAPDTTPEALLLTSRAAAGWYDWARVVELLDGRGWLDAENNGEGWQLLGRAHFAREEWERAAAAFERLARAAGEVAGRDVALAWVRRGEAMRQLGRTADALEAYDRGAELLPDISMWIDVSAAEAAAGVGDTAEVSRRLAGVDAQVVRDWGWAIRVDALRRAGDPRAARAAALAATESAASGSRRARAWMIVAELADSAGDRDASRDAYRQAIRLSPGTIAGVDAARKLTEMPGLTADDRLAIGRVYLRHGNYDRAVEGIEAYLERASPAPRERERLRMDLAHALFNGRRYDAAERQFLAVAENASSAGLAAEALFFAGRSQYRDGRITQGEQTFERVAQRYPGQAAAARALYISADLAQDDGEFDAARAGFRRAVDSGVGVEEVGFASMRLGGLAATAGDWAEAARIFDEYRRRWPQGRRWGQATYWSGLAHARLGRDSVARARFQEVRRVEPISYYGGRAAEIFGEDLLDFPMKTSPGVSAGARATVEDALAAYDLLRELDWNDAAAWQLDRVRSRFAGRDDTAYALAESLNERGHASMGIALGWDLFGRSGGWNPRLLRIIYPFPFRSLVVAEARERGVDPFLAAGLIRQESMFQPAARSGANAVGLMQVLPETGEVLAGRLGVPRFRDDMLTHPEINVLMGMVYLKEQLDDYDGRLPLVLGAYNAGPHRITRWSEFPEFEDDELFAERIPFEETRDYVKIVQQNAKLYASLWSAD